MELKRAIRTALSIKNPSYHKLLKINPRLRFAPHVSEFIKYYAYDKATDRLSFGRGCEGRLAAYLGRVECEVRQDDRRVVRSAELDRCRPIELRPYQVGVPGTVASGGSGVVRCDTGWGKSALALEVARLLNQRTLIIVPKLDLLTQFVADARTFLGVQAGVIQAGRCVIKDITIATVQTLQKRIAQGAIRPDEFGCVIVDECHLTVPAKTRKVIEFFRARHRYGFTGTNRRTDGQGGALEFLYGPVLYDGKMPRKAPTVHITPYPGRLEGLEYAEIIDEQVADGNRNWMIRNIAADEMFVGRKVLILTKRVAHYEELHRLLSPLGGTFTIASDSKRDDRRTALDRFRADPSSFNCLLGTFSLLSTGVDIPALDTLIIAGDLKSDVLAEQSAGRILRLFEGKADPLIIDIADSGNGILKNQARLRRKFYGEQGWMVRDF